MVQVWALQKAEENFRPRTVRELQTVISDYEMYELYVPFMFTFCFRLAKYEQIVLETEYVPRKHEF